MPSRPTAGCGRRRCALSAFGRCIAPDLRGFGESDIAPPYAMDQYADDLAALLNALGVREPVVLAGLSMGGYVAFAFWRRHRARVRALVLADTRAGADGDTARVKRRQLIATARTEGSAAVADIQITGLLGKRTRSKRPALVSEVRAMLASAPPEGIVGASEAMLTRPDSTPDLAGVGVPTLIVVGEDDVTTPHAEAAAMHAAVRGSRLEVIPGAGHLSNLERPSAFNQVVSEFLAEVMRA